MKKLLFFFSLMLVELALAQPYAFKYQAVVRDANGAFVANQSVSFQIQILEGQIDSGKVVYREEHSATTGLYGNVTLEIGRGQRPAGIFSEIAWANTTHFIQIAWDLSGGTNYEPAGTSELLSVPYALVAAQAQTLAGPNIVQLTNYTVLEETYCGNEKFHAQLAIELTYELLGDGIAKVSLLQNGEVRKVTHQLLNWENNLVTASVYYDWLNAPNPKINLGDEISVMFEINGATDKAIMIHTTTISTDACGGVGPELCDNGIDDDLDGFIDCYDTDCTCETESSNLKIIEVYYDSEGADMVEWVKLYNSGTSDIDLSAYSFGSGGTTYSTFKVQLSGVVAANSCYVFGKGAGDSLNYNLKTESMTLQNGGAEADGVALFLGTPAQINATKVPIDVVLYGTPGSNSNNLLGTDGNIAPVLAPDVDQNNSILYDFNTSSWRANPNPRPDTCR